MNPPQKKALSALAALLGAFALVTGLRLSKSHSKQRPCEPTVSADRLRELGVEVPSNVLLCRGDDTSYGARYHVVLARASALCVVSFGAVGCPSARQEGLRWTLDMTGRGWGTGRLGHPEGSSLVYELERPDASVSLSLYEDPFHEVTGLLQVTASRPTGRRALR